MASDITERLEGMCGGQRCTLCCKAVNQVRTRCVRYRKVLCIAARVRRAVGGIDVVYVHRVHFLMRFDWDPAKNRRNVRDHGIDFEDAKAVFDGPRGSAGTIAQTTARSGGWRWGDRGD